VSIVRPVKSGAALDPHIRELEETFVSCLGWGLVKSVDNYDRWMPYVSAGLGLDPSCIVNVDLREIYEAIRTHYLDTESFTWQAVRLSLVAQGWFGEWGTSYASKRHTAYVDVVCNQFTTVGAIPSLRKLIEAEAEKRGGAKIANQRGYR
jgi:hypothetical protein